MKVHPLNLYASAKVSLLTLRSFPSSLRSQMLSLSSSSASSSTSSLVNIGQWANSKRQFSSSSDKAETCDNDVLVESLSGGKGLIKLNRPKQLNTLNSSMVKKLRSTMLNWKNEKYLIVIKGEGDKAFCAGGDVVAVTKDKSGEIGKNFFKEEYKLDALISSMKIPVVSIISGIVMGGGVGISRFGKYRVATETSMFAMPETQIGFFPDVGISYHLARMPNHLGDFLALTGYRLKGFDLVHAGVATHFCNTNKLQDLEHALLHDFSRSVNSTPEEILKEFHQEALGSKPPPFSLSEHMSTFDKWFSGNSMEEVMKKITSEKSKFAEETAATLNKMSPLSLKVTFKQIKEAAKLNIFECFNMDYRIAVRMMEHGDFAEGVRALLVDKDKKPKWKHSDITKVKDEEVNEFFAARDDELQLPDSMKNIK